MTVFDIDRSSESRSVGSNHVRAAGESGAADAPRCLRTHKMTDRMDVLPEPDLPMSRTCRRGVSHVDTCSPQTRAHLLLDVRHVADERDDCRLAQRNADSIAHHLMY